MMLYKLKFTSPFHLSSDGMADGPSESFIRSDTLFSAICSAGVKLHGDEFVAFMTKPGNVRLSSAFPYHKEELFFPRPANFNPVSVPDAIRKEVKKLKFISRDIFFNIIKGMPIPYHILDRDYFLRNCWHSKKITECYKKGENIFGEHECPHISVDRMTNATTIFYKTEINFHSDSGLFFIADVADGFRRQFEASLRLLGDEGIGADRSIGKGLFEIVNVEEIDFPKIKSEGSYYFLSLYSPTQEEVPVIDPSKSSYDFVIRKGWVSDNTLKRKGLRMFIEGSVLKYNDNTPPVGCVRKVLSAIDYPDDLPFDIFRSGLALCIPISGGKDE
jgi:CRISPR-associated protein Csm4